MKNNNPTGKGGFGQNKQNRNSGGVPVGLKEKYNTYREMVLDWANNPEKFKKWANQNESDAFKLAATLLPKELDLGNKDGKPLSVIINYPDGK